MKKNLGFIICVLFCLSFDIIYGQGCSQCKLVAEQASEVDNGSFGSNINSGILYLMLIPYLILSFLFRSYIIAFFKGLFKRFKSA
tara:strand:- start:97 stop:351 length:255 start_codon:yes stop_codon:yes gene_type:complete